MPSFAVCVTDTLCKPVKFRKHVCKLIYALVSDSSETYWYSWSG